MISDDGRPGSKTTNLIVGCVIVLAILCVIILIYFVLRSLRARNYEPKFIPTKFLKRKWKEWVPRAAYGHVPSNSGAGRDGSSSLDLVQNTAYAGAGAAEMEATQAAIDRHTSIRSIITLPAYSPIPKPSEQVIGREGERAGMDVVVEFPETVDEEETRREEEMETLYQIRLRRRQEIAEREERRRIRREARERGDWVLLEQLRAESSARVQARANNETVSAASLLAEHQSRGRERRISSVSYAAVGHVRHDGSRLRASSQGSDSRPLLDTPAAMAQGGSGMPPMHRRTLSSTSVLSQSTIFSDAENAPTPETDIADSSIPQPPPYEDLGEAPPYPESPQFAHQPTQLAPNSNVPSIAVENATPPPSTPHSPVFPSRSAVSVPP
ncbi:hypothetical protein D8B26_004538 [Coccidioides posadasii str. Silveira]|uniref:uncharacterized protein n=1 Tax=Coccidioides posadasii (strain RMSCC 757 / Silveira) TaxID=443226 RepID=UPI001BEF4433|nr:hypothetical protein D8B26_004538 [Coccidioides posadasii str. Silveira]